MASNDDAVVNSSVKSESLKEIWRIIDEHENGNPQLNDIDAAKLDHNPFSSAVKITGLKPNEKNDQKQASKLAPDYSKSPRPKANSIPNTSRNTEIKLKPKIRNYNDKS